VLRKSVARLTRLVPWLCVPASRRVSLVVYVRVSVCVSPASVAYTLALSTIGRSSVDLNGISTGLSDREWAISCRIRSDPSTDVRQSGKIDGDQWSSGL